MTARTDLGAIPDDLADALSTLQDALPADAEDTPAGDAFVFVATFAEVAVRLMREARPSAVRDSARTAELVLRMPGGPAGALLDGLRRVRVAEVREVPAQECPAMPLDGPQGDFPGAGGQMRENGTGGAA